MRPLGIVKTVPAALFAWVLVQVEVPATVVCRSLSAIKKAAAVVAEPVPGL
jgi:hypothetical protein